MNDVLNHLCSINNAQLNPTTEHSVNQLEEALCIRMSSELKKLLMLHNGDKEGQSLLGDFKYLMSASDIVRFYNELIEDALDMKGLDCSDYENYDKRIYPYLWSKRWIPFLLDNDLFYAIDLNPTEFGTYGQVILVVWENNENYLCSSSISEFFKLALESKKQGCEWPFNSLM